MAEGRLRKILNKHHLGCCGGDYCQHDNEFTGIENMEVCLASIRELVEGLRKPLCSIYFRSRKNCEIKDWNAAIDKVLEELGN